MFVMLLLLSVVIRQSQKTCFFLDISTIYR